MIDWTDPDTIATLRQYWADGHSAAAIGLLMHTSKNAIVGKAHRLKLPGRPSPIHPSGVPAAYKQPKRVQRGERTIPPLLTTVAGSANPPPDEPLTDDDRHKITVLRSLGTPWTEVADAMGRAVTTVQAYRPIPQPKPVEVAPAPLAKAAAPHRFRPCCWPLGEPHTPSFRFCDAAAVLGRPYCAEHAAIAYVPQQRPVRSAAA